MRFFDSIINKARSHRQTIVLAEGEDPRVIEAARRATDHEIAHCVLVGNREHIQQQATESNFDLADIKIEDPAQSQYHRR